MMMVMVMMMITMMIMMIMMITLLTWSKGSIVTSSTQYSHGGNCKFIIFIFISLCGGFLQWGHLT